MEVVNTIRNNFNISETIPGWILLLSATYPLAIRGNKTNPSLTRYSTMEMRRIIRPEIESAYINSHDLMEYGKTILDYILENEISIRYGLNISASDIHNLKLKVLENLPQIICQELYGTIDNCSFFIKALIGAYYYIMNLDETYSWIVNKSPIAELITKYIWSENTIYSVRFGPPLGFRRLKDMNDVIAFLNAYTSTYRDYRYRYLLNDDEDILYLYKLGDILNLCPDGRLNLYDIFNILKRNNIWVARFETKNIHVL